MLLELFAAEGQTVGCAHAVLLDLDLHPVEGYLDSSARKLGALGGILV